MNQQAVKEKCNLKDRKVQNVAESESHLSRNNSLFLLHVSVKC